MAEPCFIAQDLQPSVSKKQQDSMEVPSELVPGILTLEFRRTFLLFLPFLHMVMELH